LKTTTIETPPPLQTTSSAVVLETIAVDFPTTTKTSSPRHNHHHRTITKTFILQYSQALKIHYSTQKTKQQVRRTTRRQVTESELK
jgi:hypothetical protein